MPPFRRFLTRQRTRLLMRAENQQRYYSPLMAMMRYASI